MTDSVEFQVDFLKQGSQLVIRQAARIPPMLAWIPGQVFDQSEFDLDRAELADIDMKHVRGV